MYIVLEFADGGELFDHIVENGAFGEEQARNIFIQLLNGVIYLHSLGIAHRDLKPENILVHREVIKITDFGLAKLSENKSFMKTLCGTPQYVAPEIIRMASQNDPEGIPGYTTAVDMWSLGVILFLLLTGRQPFTQDNGRTMSLYSQIENVDYQYPPPEDGIFVPDAAKDLITKLLQLEPANRLTATQALQHPWIASALAKQQQASSSSSHHLPETANGGQGNNKLASASLFATPSGAHTPGGNNFDHRIDAGGGITPHMPSGAGWQSMDTSASTPDRNEAPSRKRPFSSMDDAPPATSKPSNEGRGGAHAGAKASAFSSSAASSAVPPAPSPFAAPSSAMHPNAFQASSSSAMDTDPSETSAAAGPSNANAHHGFSAQPFASPSGDPAQFMQYGSSATYIDTNIKRRKLADPNAQNQNPVHMTQ
jgi:serine/threonine protein kinase